MTRRLRRSLILGACIAMGLSLAFVLFGEWENGWTPKARWARVVFFPGTEVGRICWERLPQTSLQAMGLRDNLCRTAGILTMGIVGLGLAGLVQQVCGTLASPRDDASIENTRVNQLP